MDSSQAKPGKGSILVVDDDLSARQTLTALMEAEGYEVRCAPSGQTALLFAGEEPPDLVLLDVRLPDVDGFEVCRRLKEGEGTRNVPVIFLSALEESRDKVNAFAAGGADYITKPFHAEEVLARVQTHVALHRMQNDLEGLVGERTVALNRSEEELRERLQFEMLLAELSANFVNLPIDQIDHQIGEAQRRLCEFIKVDLSGYWQIVSRDPLEFALTHLYRPIGPPPLPEPFKPQIYFPWGMRRLLSGETIAVSRHADLPPEAHRDQETWRHLGIKSTLAIPLSAGGGPVFGALSFDMMREERAWPEPLIVRLRLVAQVFANALTRKRTEEELRESEARLSLATAGAGVGLWSMDVDTNRVWVTSRTRELFHFAPNADVTYDSFLDVIHAEDRELMRQAVRQVLESGKSLLSEFRIVLPGGNVRWIVARGKTHFKPSGEPDRLVGISVDISERKHAEEALRESEARFRNMADTAPVLIWMSGPDKLCTYLNQQWLEFTGRTLAQELGNGWAEGVHREDSERCLQIYAASFDARHAFEMEYRLRRADGEYRWVFERGVPRISPAGEFLGYIVSCIDVTERKQMEEQLQAKLLEIEGLKKELEQENVYLREEVRQRSGHDEVVGQSDAMQHVLAQVDQAAPTNSTVLITGETGVGKEVIARMIHSLSKRKARALVTVNCASLPPSLIESELFGREKGAYTGAMTMMKGRFEFADGSTLFLDEIAELPLDVQAKLLRVLEEGCFERLGSPRTIHVDVRILAASNRDLARDVEAGRFRKDLYYRLNVFPVEIPPLRERPEDIPLLVWSFVRDFEKKMGKRIESIPRRTMESLQRYAWPGNVRELRNVVEHAMIISSGNRLDVRMPTAAAKELPAFQALEDVEKHHILSVLEKTKWRLTGEGGAAELLGLKRTTLQSRMKKLGIKRPTS